MMDDLERHAMRRRMNGFPVYGITDDDGDSEIVGFIDEPEWDWSALSDDQQAVIRATAMSFQKGRELTWDDVFPIALGEFGIRCPHLWVNHEPAFRECRWCRVAEQLPGRVVRVAGRTMRVSDPPPPLLRIPVSAAPSVGPYGGVTAGYTVDEYRWTGRVFELNRKETA